MTYPVANPGEICTKPCETEIDRKDGMTDRLLNMGSRMQMLACGLDNLYTRLFVGGENAQNFKFDPATGSIADILISINELTNTALKILENIHNEL